MNNLLIRYQEEEYYIVCYHVGEHKYIWRIKPEDRQAHLTAIGRLVAADSLLTYEHGERIAQAIREFVPLREKKQESRLPLVREPISLGGGAWHANTHQGLYYLTWVLMAGLSFGFWFCVLGVLL